MDRDDVWKAIDDQRRRLAGMLEDLSEQEWQHPSLCRGWMVRQVAAHVALQDIRWSMMPRAVLDMVRPGGMNEAIHAMACRHAENPTGQIIADIRDRIGVWRPLPSLTYRDTAVDCHWADLDLRRRPCTRPPKQPAVVNCRTRAALRTAGCRRSVPGRRLPASTISPPTTAPPRSRSPPATGRSTGCRCAGTAGSTTRSTWPRSPRSATLTATAAPATTASSPRARR
jgi:hypothetical protein